MICRRAEEADRPAVADVWQEAFGDGPEEANRYLNGFVGYENQFVAEEEGAVAAILSAVPCSFGGQPGAYFFALATKKALRGRGLMAALMAHAEADCQNRGLRFSCLIPAEGSLFGYYQKQGYHNAFSRALALRPGSLAAGQTGPENKELEPVTLESLRRRFLPGSWLSFSQNSQACALEGARAAGCRLAAGENAYAVFMEKEGCLALPELGAKTDEDARALVAALCAQTGKEKAVLTLPQNSALLAGEGEHWPLAQWKPLDKNWNGNGFYLRFGLDEVFEKNFENPELLLG